VLDNDFELAPALPISSTGVLWDLDEGAFLRWWRALPQVDREEFTNNFDGDEILARFVCAIHYLSSVQRQSATPSLIVTAYGIAARLSPNAPETRIRASKAWRADCVQMLLMRLHQRSAEQAKARILNSATHVIEVGLNDSLLGDVKDKALMVQAAMKFVKLVNDQEAEERRERQKRGWQKVIDDSKKELSGEVEAPSIEQAKLYQRMLQSSLGPEQYAKLLQETAISEA
jgi:hypothetical protein